MKYSDEDIRKIINEKLDKIEEIICKSRTYFYNDDYINTLLELEKIDIFIKKDLERQNLLHELSRKE